MAEGGLQKPVWANVGHATLMRPIKVETAVYGCLTSAWEICLRVGIRSWPHHWVGVKRLHPFLLVFFRQDVDIVRSPKKAPLTPSILYISLLPSRIIFGNSENVSNHGRGSSLVGFLTILCQKSLDARSKNKSSREKIDSKSQHRGKTLLFMGP